MDIGRAITLGLDALIGGFVAGLGAFVVSSGLRIWDPGTVTLVVGGVAAVASLAASLALSRAGRRPYLATRVARRIVYNLDDFI